MDRVLWLVVLTVSVSLSGCATVWDTVTSRRFREQPFKTVRQALIPEDPAVVLWADPPRSGDDRAQALHRLQEPLRHGGTPEDQDRVLELLARIATTDNSVVLRNAAIDALSRFRDPRVVAILMQAYHQADGIPPATPPQLSDPTAIIPNGGLSAGRAPTRPGIEPSLLTGPTGFAPDHVAALRCRCLEALGQTQTAEAARFLAAVAGGEGKEIAPAGSDQVEVRQAAVRGLARCRQPEAVQALARVLQAQAGQDVILARMAHQGLIRLTGKKLPPDPARWNEVVQANLELAPEPTWLQQAIERVGFWTY
ncbi:MAG: hypothetical protein RMJ56_17320 [Gemmataceae bacterium]|nr:hypothetical protein [Gemmata sp.]MDW8199357.1 hypothetical protein [Gemmataceae bacterium]